jgi:hypothetical protein
MPHTSNQNFVLSRKHCWILVLLVIFTALFRIRNVDSLWNGDFLWAEDGNVFINEASSLGIASLWHSYAGYLHLYPRIIAYISNAWDLSIKPFPMVLAWFAAYLYMFFVLIRGGINLGFNFRSLVLLVLLVSWQPNSGEVFFNITNAQWLLGVALTLLVVEGRKYSYFSVPGLVVLGLTGPFVIILLPVLMGRALYFKDIKESRWLYISLIVCAVVQIYYLATSGRVSADVPMAPLYSWLLAFLKMLLLGAKDWIFAVIASFFWIGVIFAILAKREAKESSERIIQILMLFTAAFLFYLAAAYSSKINPVLIAPSGPGNRYSWIPFTLIFFSVIWCSRHKLAIQIFIFLMAFVVCADSFRQKRVEHLQYQSFAHFSRYTPLIIPINPVWEVYPSWHINSDDIKKKSDQIVTQTITWYAHKADGDVTMPTVKDNAVLFAAERISCPMASDVAVEIEATRQHAGWANMLWSSNPMLSGWTTLRRWYPNGQHTMQFAFPYSEGGMEIGLLLTLFSEQNDQIHRARAFCLPK